MVWNSFCPVAHQCPVQILNCALFCYSEEWSFWGGKKLPFFPLKEALAENPFSDSSKKLFRYSSSEEYIFSPPKDEKPKALKN